MSYQTVFQRYELKYLLTLEQKEIILKTIEPYMALDRYGKTTVRNIYFDTDTYLLVRRSIEKPIYKEKLRIRSYAQASSDSTVFAELKRKYDGIVYKRRIDLPERDAVKWISGKRKCPRHTQISNEIDYFLSRYGTLYPSAFISYDREAYACRDGGDFRVTFDERVLCRTEDMTLTSEVYGTPVLDDKAVLMEIKCSGGIPMPLSQTLSRERIYKTSFSKYGSAYEKIIYPVRHPNKTEFQRNPAEMASVSL